MTRPSAPVGLDRASGWMLGGVLSFALMGTLVHALGPRCDWLVVATVRALMMLASASAMARASGATLAVWRPRTLWLRSLAGSFSLVCNFYAMARLPVADAITLSSVNPLWIVLITAAILRKAPSRGEVLGVLCGLAGVVVIEQPHVGVDRLAAAVALLSSVSTAVAMLGLHRLKNLDSRAVVAHFAGVASLVSAAWLLIRGEPLSTRILDPTTVWLLVGVGISGTLGQVLLTKAYSAGAPSRVAVVGLSQVVFAMTLDVVFWGRILTPLTFLGFLLVMGPTTWLSLRAARERASSPTDDPGSDVGHPGVVAELDTDCMLPRSDLPSP